MMNEMQTGSKKKVLEDLMANMDDREANRKMGKLLTITVGVGEDGCPEVVDNSGEENEANEEDMSGDGMSGLDPRVVELIRKKEQGE